MVEGQYFSENTLLSTCLLCLSYNKQVYPSPFSFRPERWISDFEDPDGSSPEGVTLAESGFCTFSYGTRSCFGMNLAWMEIMVVFAKMVYLYKLRQDPASKIGGGSLGNRSGLSGQGVYQIRDAFVAMRDGPMVQFKEREA